jgi:hypothetical protein
MNTRLKRSSAWLTSNGWTCQEAGWWTHETHGGICIEHDGKWWAWSREEKKRGPYKTAVEAARSNWGHSNAPEPRA